MQQIFDGVLEIFKKVFPVVSDQLIWKLYLLLPAEAAAFFSYHAKAEKTWLL